jgi:transposase InsO family protein
LFKLSIINKAISHFSYIVESSSLWHGRLAHLNFKYLKYMSKHGLISYKHDNNEKCEIFIQAKVTKKPFPTIHRNSQILELIHSDICELNGILTRGGKSYFITFIDDFSRYTYVYLMKNKDEAFSMFKRYKYEVENKKEKKIKTLRTDRGREYFPHEFSTFCEEHGIVHQKFAPYTPQQNGLAERKNRTLVDMVNCMILSAKLHFNLWGEALLTACHVYNKVSSIKMQVSPYELWNDRKPNLDYLRVWGCLAFYRVPDPKRNKLGPRAIKSVFVGYAENSKAYRLLDLSSNVIVESRDVEFIENKFNYDSKYVSEPNQTQVSDSYPSTFLNNDKRLATDLPIEQRKSQRVRKEKNFGPDFISLQAIVFLVEGNMDIVISKIPIVLNTEDDPKSFSEAMSFRDAVFWKEAVNDEMDSILLNNTWVLVDLPLGSKPICCKWVFRRKYNSDGSIQTFKARLVAKSFKQKEGIDYFDTYAPVARITSICILMALASIYDLYVHQIDVKTAFLNGDLDEEVYMEQPEGFILPNNEKKVCKLVKSLYGLKQTPKQWHEKFDTVILSNGFKYNGADKCIYSKFTKDYGVIVCLYVDDMLIFGTNMKGVCETKKYLTSMFKMKDLNEVDTILGIKVKKHSEGYALCQSHYIEKVLLKFKHLGIKEALGPPKNLSYTSQCYINFMLSIFL